MAMATMKVDSFGLIVMKHHSNYPSGVHTCMCIYGLAF